MTKHKIRTLLGQYESWLLTLYGRKTMMLNDRRLETFFGLFPKTIYIESITVSEIAEFLEQAHTLFLGKRCNTDLILNALNRFYRYLIEDRNLPLHNPVKPYLVVDHPKPPPRRNNILRISDFKKLFACADPSLKQYLVDVICRENKTKPAIPPYWVRVVLGRAKVEAGLPFVTMKLIRKAVASGLWRDIIKDYAVAIGTQLEQFKASDPSVYKPEPPRDLWGDIKPPTVNVWATISDPDKGDAACYWIT